MGFHSHLFFFFSLFLIFITFSLSFSQRHDGPRLLDSVVRDHAFQCYADHQSTKTALLYPVPLPPSLPGVRAHTARYRTGSLRRYGAQIHEFRLSPGTNVRPHVERVVLVRESWALPWSSSLYNISGFRLLSPVLGILAYDAGRRKNSSRTPSELEIFVERRPISIDFSNISSTPSSSDSSSSSGVRLLCAYFDVHGKVRVYDPSMAMLKVCDGFREGHYALVMEGLKEEKKKERKKKKKKMGGDGDGFEKKWRVVIGSSVVGGALVVVLLGLLCVALVEMRKKREMEEMERKAYEEEALQMALVGHFIAPTARGTRTLPSIDIDFKPFL
ncbi:hypothetical protein AAC387_Pa08g1764 [Persea americana]